MNPLTSSQLDSITASHSHPNGCRLPVTWFALATADQGTSCKSVRARARLGDEIAVHTVTHAHMYPEFPAAARRREVAGGRALLESGCGLAAGSVAGFRGPYLVHNPANRKVLHEAGFTYDASITSNVEDVSHRLWPYTMDRGIPQQAGDGAVRLHRLSCRLRR